MARNLPTQSDSAINNLSPEESDAYFKYVASGKHPLAPDTSAKLYQLYLHGCSTSDILAMNSALGLGVIVRAKIDNEWDKKRAEYTADLMNNIHGVVARSQMESVQFTTLWASAFQKLVGTKLKQFIQSGDENDLGDVRDQLTPKNYQAVLTLLMQVTGQDKRGANMVHATKLPEPVAAEVEVKESRAITASEADEMLKRLGQ